MRPKLARVINERYGTNIDADSYKIVLTANTLSA
jgi:hypothetical protein